MRLFWALAPPQEVVAAVDRAVRPLRERWPELRWTATDGWHVTLAFLGDVAEERVDHVVAVVREAVGGSGSVPLELRQYAGTPGGGRGIVWIPLVPSPPASALATSVQDACRTVVDVEERRVWRAHLTLARVPRRVVEPGRLAAAVAAAYAGPRIGWTADTTTLVHSTTAPDGARYRTVAEVALRA